MLAFTARRLAWMLPLLLFGTVVVFFAVFALPGDPVQSIAGGANVPPQTRRAIEARYRLDDPLPVQYGTWLADVARGDLGESFQNRRAVRDILFDAVPNSVRLALLALGIELVIGLGAGVVSAVTRRPFVDVLVTVSTLAAIALPVYVVGLLAQWTLGVEWGWVPVAGTDSGLRSWLLPAAVLAIPSLAYVTRLLRESLRQELREPYVVVATTKGLPRRSVVGRHAMRNALPPVVTFIALDFGVLMGGAIVVEALFDIRGIGFTMVEAIRDRDHPVIIGASLVLIVVFLVANLVGDLVVRDAGSPCPSTLTPSPRRAPRRTLWRRVGLWVGVGGVALLLVIALFPGTVVRLSPATGDPLACSLRGADGQFQDRLPPSSEHWFGTDVAGLRLLHAGRARARVSLAVAIGAVAIASAIGALVGGTAGYVGGRCGSRARRVRPTSSSVSPKSCWPSSC